MHIPDRLTEDQADRLTEDQEEILITLRALAGLVAQALRRKAALDVAAGADVVEQASTEVLFWRAFLLHHTRRLLPALVGAAHARAYRRFAEELVRAVYLEDGDAIARHGCDPETCTYEAHVRD